MCLADLTAAFGERFNWEGFEGLLVFLGLPWCLLWLRLSRSLSVTSKSVAALPAASGDCPIQSHPSMNAKSELKCCNCGHNSYTRETVIDLSLEIEYVDTLSAALESFTNVETMEDPDCKFKCESYIYPVGSNKQRRIWCFGF